jgi:predicted ferric reductase
MIHLDTSKPAGRLAEPLLAVVALLLVALLVCPGWQENGAEAGGAARLGGLVRGLGLAAAGLLLAQVLLASRLKWLDRILPLDRRLGLHRWLGPIALVLATAHPLVLFSSPGFQLGPLSWRMWPLALGATLLLGLWITVFVAFKRASLRLPYQQWRAMHRLGFVPVLLIVVHALAVGDSFQDFWAVLYGGLLVGGMAAAMIWLRLLKPARLRSQAWMVKAVEPLNQTTTSLQLAPPNGLDFSYLPGQFAFITPLSGRLPREEHPFTIASSPDRTNALEFCIKDSGDFTARMGQAAAGDRFQVDGPHGGFSHLLHQGDELVFIAGGIGITPLLGMLRHLAAGYDKRFITLIWSNRGEADLIHRQEMVDFKQRLVNFHLHLVMSRQENWQGPQGRLDEPMLFRLLADHSREAQVFICGPPAMIVSTRKRLDKLGFSRVHSELFSLAK